MTQSFLALGAVLALLAGNARALPYDLDTRNLELRRSGLAAAQGNPGMPLTGLELAEAAIAAPEEPEQLLADAVDSLRAFMSANERPDPEALRDFLDETFAPMLDLDYMARWAAGPHFEQMNESQRERFKRRLRHVFLHALARNMGAFLRPLPRMDLIAPRQPWRQVHEVIVRMHVLPGRGYPQRLDFRFHETGEGWKVFDVASNGVSAAGYYRTFFAALVRRDGPGALID